MASLPVYIERLGQFNKCQVGIYSKLGKVSFYLTFQLLKCLEVLVEYQLGIFYSRIALKVVLTYIKLNFSLAC